MSDWPDLSSTNITTTSAGLASADPPIKPSIELQQPGQSESASTYTRCPLLDLPPEMRLDIYELALLDTKPTASRLSLLRTCRHINMEARSTIYKRPSSFTSQAKLFAWINRSRKQDLKRVRMISLRLTDIDLSSLLDQVSNSPLTARTSVWTLYQAELERLDDALRALPSLSSLTIVPPTVGRSQLLKGLYHSFLALLPQRCPKLKHLEIQDGEEILNLVPALRDVKGVSCTDSSERSPSLVKGVARSEEQVKIEVVERTDVGRADASPVHEGSISPRGVIERARSPGMSQVVDARTMDQRAIGGKTTLFGRPLDQRYP